MTGIHVISKSANSLATCKLSEIQIELSPIRYEMSQWLKNKQKPTIIALYVDQRDGRKFHRLSEMCLITFDGTRTYYREKIQQIKRGTTRCGGRAIKT